VAAGAKESPDCVPGLKGLTGQHLDTIPRHKSRKARIAMDSARRFSHRERGENPKQLLTRLEISFELEMRQTN
jgi:hypothetical protein